VDGALADVRCCRVNDSETADRSLRDKAAEYITRAFPTHAQFYPDHLFIATWNEVGYYDSQNDKVFLELGRKYHKPVCDTMYSVNCMAAARYMSLRGSIPDLVWMRKDCV